METKRNTLFNQRLQTPNFQLILMILLFLLTLAWALPTVPFEVDAVASTIVGAFSFYLPEKGYQLSRIALYNHISDHENNNFRGI